MEFSQYRYYSGRRVAGLFTFNLGGSLVHCEIDSRWHNTGRSHNVRCGLSSEMSGSHEAGVEISELDLFSASIESSIGVKGVASLKSGIEAATQLQITWQRKQTYTDTYKIPAPDCGSQTWVLFQLARDYRFTIETRRLLRKPKVTPIEIREKTFHFDFLIDDNPHDPACPCPDGRKMVGGEIISLQLGNLGLRIDAFPISESRYWFRIGPTRYEVDTLETLSGPAFIELHDIPEIMQQLSGIKTKDVQAQFGILPEFSIMDLRSAEGIKIQTIESDISFETNITDGETF